MKISKVLTRWYKSFNVNYVGYTDRRSGVIPRPWNSLGSRQPGQVDFPFIEIPIEDDITTIVGANESGKSHLLSAISKVLTGEGIQNNAFSRTDLCHFASIADKNANIWPNIGLEIELENDAELQRILDAIGGSSAPVRKGGDLPRIVLILCPGNGDNEAALYVGINDQPILLKKTQLKAVRNVLPAVKFIRSNVAMADEIHIGCILADYDPKGYTAKPFYDFAAAQKAAEVLNSLTVPNGQPLPVTECQKLIEGQSQLAKWKYKTHDDVNLELLLFRDILEINLNALKYLAELTSNDRSYVESVVGKWNQEIAEKLNLSHYWQQDDKFSLQINYKQGVLHFEISDKTKSIYTFGERSSGLKFFLSYYIQAKALELSQGNRNSIIIMDEPDCYLSTLGQQNLLAVFESLVSVDSSLGTCQLIYTTHSPFLINRNFPRRIRLLKKGDAEEGTQFIDQAMIRRYEPVRSALGIDCAQTLFMGSTNLVMEGPTDQFVITELVRVFTSPEAVNEFLDLNSITVVSADGAPGVEKLLSASQWGDETVPATVVLLDSDVSGKEALDRITGISRGCKKLIDKEFVAQIGDLVKPFGINKAIVTTEDIIPQKLFSMAVNAYLVRWHAELAKDNADRINRILNGADFSKAGLIAGTNNLIEAELKLGKGSCDKMGVLQELLKLVEGFAERSDLTEDINSLRQNVMDISQALRRKIEACRQLARRRSGKQSVQRIVHDFFVTHKHSATTLDVQLLLERLDGEAESLGQDGENLKAALASWRNDIDKMRTNGQSRFAPSDWQRWSAIIENISHNPLDPNAAAQVTVVQPQTSPTALPAAPPLPVATPAIDAALKSS